MKNLKLPERIIRGAFRVPLTIRTELKHFALVTHSVPAARVRERLPSGLELETYRDDKGTERALISTASFLNTGFRPTLAPFGGMSFEQLTFRTYVKYRGRSGAYFFGTILAKRMPYLLEHLAARAADIGRFHVNRVFDKKTGYEGYSAMVRSLGMGETYFRFRANNPPKIDQVSQSLTHRLHGFFDLTVGGLGDQVVCHRRMSPWSGTLIEGRFDFWERLGMLKPEEFDTAFSVLVEPSVVFQIYPPFPARLLAPTWDESVRRLGEHGLHLPRG